jgi:hypothetical protein
VGVTSIIEIGAKWSGTRNSEPALDEVWEGENVLVWGARLFVKVDSYVAAALAIAPMTKNSKTVIGVPLALDIPSSMIRRRS